VYVRAEGKGSLETGRRKKDQKVDRITMADKAEKQ
jgi:hypothetical protein